jgi:hypothetical protein
MDICCLVKRIIAAEADGSVVERRKDLCCMMTSRPPAMGLVSSVRAGTILSSDALLLATTQHQEATDEQRQPTGG